MNRIISLCSGYEGVGMAVQEVFGGEIVAVADNDPGASKVLAYRYPGVPNLGDISKVRWERGYEGEPWAADILTAGFPCLKARMFPARAAGPGFARARARVYGLR